jgi:hypothetical protein
MVLFLDVLVVLSPWRHSVVQLRRSVTELRGLDGTIFGSIIVWQRFFLPRAEIALRNTLETLVVTTKSLNTSVEQPKSPSSGSLQAKVSNTLRPYLSSAPSLSLVDIWVALEITLRDVGFLFIEHL